MSLSFHCQSVMNFSVDGFFLDSLAFLGSSWCLWVLPVLAHKNWDSLVVQASLCADISRQMSAAAPLDKLCRCVTGWGCSVHSENYPAFIFVRLLFSDNAGSYTENWEYVAIAFIIALF